MLRQSKLPAGIFLPSGSEGSHAHNSFNPNYTFHSSMLDNQIILYNVYILDKVSELDCPPEDNNQIELATFSK